MKTLSERMHDYESVSKTSLVPRVPVIVRIDGRAFRTFTKGFKKPYDQLLAKAMQDTMMYLCKRIQGCVLGYTQSDEISLVLTDYKNIDSCAWFDYEVQKLCSIIASMATIKFSNCLSFNPEEFDTAVVPTFDARVF